MKLVLPLTFIGFVALSAAVGIGDLPPCAAKCASNLPAGCSPVDIKCICSSSSWITNLAGCVACSCSPQEQQTTLTVAQQLCSAVGINNLPTLATCTSSPGSATSTSTSASSSGMPGGMGSSMISSTSSSGSTAQTSASLTMSSGASIMSLTTATSGSTTTAPASSSSSSASAQAASSTGAAAPLVISALEAAAGAAIAGLALL